MKKSVFASKTLWFNALALVVGVLTQFGYDGVIPADLQQFVLPAVFVINLILRFVTKQPIV